MEKTIHHGRNVKRFREMMRMKQEALAIDLGDDWTQRRISLLEQKEVIEPDLLKQIADILKLPVEALENFDEESPINIIANSFQDFKGNAVASAMNYHCTFNPLDKLMEVLEENKTLYERLLQAEKEKVELLQKMLDKQ
jgi:transcriptional regulator with XRE-family HTH domain